MMPDPACILPHSSGAYNPVGNAYARAGFSDPACQSSTRLCLGDELRTQTNRLGAVGKGEGIRAHALVDEPACESDIATRGQQADEFVTESDHLRVEGRATKALREILQGRPIGQRIDLLEADERGTAEAEGVELWP